MIRVFIDTDIIIDALTGRMPHATSAFVLFSMIEKGSVKAYICSQTINNTYYVLRKKHSHQKLISSLSELCDYVKIIGADQKVIEQALKSGFRDLEDAIQYSCALSIPKISLILTRNTRDYRKSKLPVMTPQQFLDSAILKAGN